MCFQLEPGFFSEACCHYNLGKFPTNPSNTSMLQHAGKLLVLCEGGSPMEVDPKTLETKGPVVFGQELPMGFSAHSR